MDKEPREIPILMDATSVRAILDGAKTQTRRPVKPAPPPRSQWHQGSGLFRLEGSRLGVMRRCPFGVPGDLLWVRETWAYLLQTGGGKRYMYRDDPYDRTLVQLWNEKWRPSIHMPRTACRITLRVRRVWVEQAQEIQLGDVIEEGCPHMDGSIFETWPSEEFEWFIKRWDSIYAGLRGRRCLSWDANPWVWACEFEMVREK